MLIKQLDAGDTVLVLCVGRRGVVVGSAARPRAQRARRRRSPHGGYDRAVRAVPSQRATSAQ
eukprot:1776249-Prymnesium_polylepis.1